MFFIGIFSSIIPYLVIAGVYLLGIGIYSIDNRHNKPVGSGTESLSSEIKIDIIEEADIYCFSDFYQDDYFNEIIPLPDIFSQNVSEFLLFTDPSPPAGTIPLKYCNRPPPAFFLS